MGKVVPGCLVCLLCATSTLWAQPDRQTFILKVFLADFQDIPRPERYTPEYFADLFFSLDGPRTTPEGGVVAGSVRQYFRNVSQGRIDIEGEVAQWVRIPRQITKIPHWKRGMKPFGESWPVIVAETLRAHGIVGEGCVEKLRLGDGRMPELLVFLNTDWGMGGVNRGWGRCKEVLGMMGLSELWDEAWLSLPQPYSSYSATEWSRAPHSAKDGTIEGQPQESEIRLFPLSVMMHEMGHQLAGWPDLYGPAFEPWGVFDLMGGPAAATHFPMGVCAYLRERSGWMQFTDMPPVSAPGLTLWPLETHCEALAFAQGPGQERIICENRRCLKYPRDATEPPADEGPILLCYRLDPAGRRRVMYGGSLHGKITTMVRRGEHYGEVWGKTPHTDLTAQTTPSSRNCLGELWWEFRGIHPVGDRMGFDALCRATDLVRGYTEATWADGSGAVIEAGHLDWAGGDVCMVSWPGAEAKHERVLHVGTAAGGEARGRYRLPAPGPHRLYLTAGLGRDSACGTEVVVACPDGVESRLVLPEDGWGAPRTLIADVPAAMTELELTVRPADAVGPAAVSIHRAWLVPMAPTAVDPLEAAPARDPEEVRLKTATTTLADGCTYGPEVLTLPLGGDAPAGCRAEWTVAMPQRGGVFRALLGLGADTPVGGAATVGLKLSAAEREWPLVANLELRASEDRADNWPAVLEAPIPAEAMGQECRLVLEAAAVNGSICTLGVPCLRVCEG